jgi:hypothetical protein
MTTLSIRRLLALSLGAALVGACAVAQAEQAWARVISATPVAESNGSTSYSVTYEYNGRQYTTRTDTRPGASIPIEVGAYGVATSPVAPQADLAQSQGQGQPQGQPDWRNVVPEPGVVVGGGQPGAVYANPAPVYAPSPVYGPPPVYVQPAPVYYPAPVYVRPYGYGYGGYGYGYAPYYPPVGISLNLGYSRGWYGGRR